MEPLVVALMISVVLLVTVTWFKAVNYPRESRVTHRFDASDEDIFAIFAQ